MYLKLNFSIIFLYFLLLKKYLKSEKLIFKEKKIFLETEEQTDEYIFGSVRYRINHSYSMPVAYQQFHNRITNQICRFMNYDNFHSFSMKYYIWDFVRTVEFITNNGEIRKYLYSFFSTI